jgi:serine/threonine-protein kinase
MLVGATPYPETTWHEIEAVRREGPPPPLEVPGLPSRVARVYELCLATDPADRPTADQVATELMAALARNRVVPTRRKARHRTRRVVTVLVVLGVLAAVLYVSLRYGGPNPGDPDVATGRGSSPDVAAITTPTVAQPSSAPPSTTPSPTPVTPSSPPSLSVSPTPPRQPSPTSAATAPRSVNEAAAQVFDLVDAGVAAGSMRSDIAIDFKNQVNNVTFHREEFATRIPELRQRIQERVRERAMTAALANQIDAAVVELGAAIQRDLAAAGSG